MGSVRSRDDPYIGKADPYIRVARDTPSAVISYGEKEPYLSKERLRIGLSSNWHDFSFHLWTFSIADIGRMYDVVKRTSETLLLAISEMYAWATHTLHHSHGAQSRLPSPTAMSRRIQSLRWRSNKPYGKDPSRRSPAISGFRHFPNGSRRKRKSRSSNNLLSARAEIHRLTTFR